MTADDFRRLALELPEAAENAHMGHPDFRVNGKIFATLNYPDERWGMVKLTPEEQDNFVKLPSNAFGPVKGAWGRQGCTSVRLEAAEAEILEHALRIAWNQAANSKKRTARKRA